MLIKQKDPTVELEALPSHCTCVGANADNILLFETTATKAPTGFTAATIQDVEGMLRYKIMRSTINDKRNDAIRAGVEVESLAAVFDTDDASVKRVSGACILAMMPMVDAQHDVLMSLATDEQREALAKSRAVFNEQWITQDDQVVAVDFDGLKQLAAAVSSNEKSLIHDAYAEKVMLKQKVFDSYNQAPAPVATPTPTAEPAATETAPSEDAE